MKSKANKLNVLFLGLAAIASILSQSVQDLFSILSVLFTVYLMIQHRQFFKKNGADWVIFAFLGFCVFGIVFQYGIGSEYLKMLKRFSWIASLYLAHMAFTYYLPKPKEALKLILYVSLIPSVYSIATVLAKTDFRYPDRWEGRAIGLVNSATYHAHASVVLAAFCIPLLLYVARKSSRIVQLSLVGSFALLFVSFYYTYTRGALLAFLIATFIYVARFGIKKVLMFVAAIGALVGVIFALDPSYSNRLKSSLTQNRGDDNRIRLYQANWDIFVDHPLLGMGYDVYKDPAKSVPYTSHRGVAENLQDSHAHNQYVQILSSTGIIGFILFMSFYLYFLWENFKMLRRKDLNSDVMALIQACFYAQIAFVFLQFTDQTFEYSKIKFILIVVWGLVLALRDQSLVKLNMQNK